VCNGIVAVQGKGEGVPHSVDRERCIIKEKKKRTQFKRRGEAKAYKKIPSAYKKEGMGPTGGPGGEQRGVKKWLTRKGGKKKTL